MNAFITNSNAKSIIYNFDVSGIDINEAIYRITFKWFSIYEIKGLLSFKLLYENPSKFFQQYKKREAIDTKQYIYEGKLPAYHTDLKCNRLLSEFRNFKIPDEIKKQGDEKITEFRLWFIENKESFDKDPEFFMERMKMRFNLTTRPELVNYSNSGADLIENLNLTELDKQIELKIIRANEFYLISDKNRIVLDNFGKFAFIHKNKKPPAQNNTQYSNDEIWEVLETFEVQYKNPIISLLREYYRVKFNPELKFEGLLLEQLGFTYCYNCQNEELQKNMHSLFL